MLTDGNATMENFDCYRIRIDKRTGVRFFRMKIWNWGFPDMMTGLINCKF